MKIIKIPELAKGFDLNKTYFVAAADHPAYSNFIQHFNEHVRGDLRKRFRFLKGNDANRLLGFNGKTASLLIIGNAVIENNVLSQLQSRNIDPVIIDV